MHIMAAYHIRKVTVKELIYRLTIPLNMRLMMTPFNIPRRKIMIQRKSQTSNTLRRIIQIAP